MCLHLKIDSDDNSSSWINFPRSHWTWLLISCFLFTIACVHLDHAFPFDLTQLYSTVNKQHAGTLTTSSAQHFVNQRLASLQRRRSKAAVPDIDTTAAPSTSESSSTTTASTTTRTTRQSHESTLPMTSTSTAGYESTASIPAKIPVPPYTLEHELKPKADTEKKIPFIKPELNVMEVVESIIVTKHKQRKVTPFPKQTDVVVETKYGKVRGMIGDIMGHDVRAFIGVPYARPPIHGLRLKKPQKLKNWTDILVTNTVRPHCVQDFREDILLSRSLTTVNMSEDCLYMNIWSVDGSGVELKPVIVWVHGGGFKAGTANIDETDGRVLSALGDVVVVTFNYRVGAFGFLDLLSDESPGNQGLYDILQALTFVKENIDRFGGDPSRVTIVGQDSGAVTAGIFLVSPKAKGLFHRAILQSGSPLFQDYFEGKNLQSSELFTERIGCSNCVNLKDKLKCLRGKTTSEILAKQKPMLSKDHHLFGPTFCEDLLPDSLLLRLQDEEEPLNVEEILMGSNRDELSISLVLDYPHMFSNKKILLNVTTLQELRSLILNIFSARGNMHDERSMQHLVDFFFTAGDEESTTENLIQRMYRVFGDAAVGCPVSIFAELLVKRQTKVFLYEFNQRAQNMVWGSWMGVPIGTEIPYIFGHPLRYPRVYSKDDLIISKRLIATWSQFARNGTVPEQLGHEWEPFSMKKPSFMEINPREAVYGSRVDNGVCNIFRMALSSRNETTSEADCSSRVTSPDDEIDLENGLYEETTTSSTDSDEGLVSSTVATEPPVISCPLFLDDADGPSIDYYDYQVVDLKILPVIGSKAVFYCEPDEEMVGQQVLTCQTDGVWSSEKPICQRKTSGSDRKASLVPHFFCDFFPEPLNDDRLRVDYEKLYTLNDSTTFAVKGSLAHFKCFPMNSMDDVRLVGQATVECSRYGIWSSIEPSCQTVIHTQEVVTRDFKQQFFLIGLILVIVFALFVMSVLLYSKLSVKEYTSQQREQQISRNALITSRRLEELPVDGQREECELLQVNREFGDGSEISPEDMEVISILSKARYAKRQTAFDRNMNLVRSRGSTGASDCSDESASSPETVLWVHR